MRRGTWPAAGVVAAEAVLDAVEQRLGNVRARYVVPGDLRHQMEMILHQAERVNLPSRLGARLAKGFEETVPIPVIPETGFAPVP